MVKATNCMWAVLLMLLLPAVGQVYAQKSLPAVPITYQGDTDETISRRAQWIEGAKKEKALVWWGGINPNAANAVIKEFNALYPFIAVEYWNARGEEKSVKMETGYAAGQHVVDILLGGETYNYPRWRKMGILAKFAGIVPRVDRLDKRMYGSQGDYFVSYHTVVTPQYNTKLVTAAEAPKSWTDLLDPRWKGQVGMTDDIKAWTVLAVADGGWGIEKTEDFLKKLKEQNIVWGRGHTGHHALLIAGEYKVNAEGYVYHAILSKRKGAPVEWVKADPAVLLGPSTTLMSKAPHPNAARLFLEWHFSPQGMITFEKISGTGSAYPGSGTYQSKVLEGVHFVDRTEEVQMKILDLNVDDRLSRALGLAK